MVVWLLKEGLRGLYVGCLSSCFNVTFRIHILYGTGPFGGLIGDAAGDLYGTTEEGGTGNGGTAFELSPPSVTGNPWTEKLLWNFGSGTDGALPSTSLITDSLGNLYGTTLLGGLYDDHKALNRDDLSAAGKVPEDCLSPTSRLSVRLNYANCI